MNLKLYKIVHWIAVVAILSVSIMAFATPPAMQERSA